MLVKQKDFTYEHRKVTHPHREQSKHKHGCNKVFGKTQINVHSVSAVTIKHIITEKVGSQTTE